MEILMKEESVVFMIYVCVCVHLNFLNSTLATAPQCNATGAL